MEDGFVMSVPRNMKKKINGRYVLCSDNNYYWMNYKDWEWYYGCQDDTHNRREKENEIK